MSDGRSLSSSRNPTAVKDDEFAREMKSRVEDGIQKCRQGLWAAGMKDLAWVAERNHSDVDLPGQFYSYLGYGIAKEDKKYREGLKLCKHAVKIQYYEPDNFLNLARVHLLTHDRDEALAALRTGLGLDSSHRGLIRLWREVGVRDNPPIPFLSRHNPINRALASLRKSPKGGSRR